jgi:ribose 5-phosphate isomerase A
MDNVNQLAAFKQAAAEHAVTFVTPGMVVGLGVGSTAIFAVRRLAQLLAEGVLTDIVGIPCANSVEQEARRLGIPLTTLNDHPVVDITIDGADEAARRGRSFDLIKGGGGALLKEKIVAQASQREVIVIDEGKLSPQVGMHWPVPVEVIPFGWRAQAAYIEGLGARVVLRQGKDQAPYTTDQGNFILDCHFGPISQPAVRARQLAARAGIVEHGLFVGLATDVIVAGVRGVRHFTADRAAYEAG